MMLAEVALLLEHDPERHAHREPERHLALAHPDDGAEHPDLLPAAKPDKAFHLVAEGPDLTVAHAVAQALLAEVDHLRGRAFR